MKKNRTYFKTVLIFCLAVTINLYEAQQPSLQWAKSLSGQGNCRSNAQCTDLIGNIYSTGTFTGTFDFDPGTGVNTFSNTATDCFINKLDASGNLIFNKVLKGNAQSNGITTDANNFVYITGVFYSVVDFDPGINTYTAAPVGGSSFILKLDPSGEFVWVKFIESQGGVIVLNAIKTDQSGNIVVTGRYSGTTDVDPGSGIYNITTNGTSDILLVKLNPSGNFLWANSNSGSSTDVANSLNIDANGNIILVGFFMNTVDFDAGPGAANLTSNGGQEIFILKVNSLGSFLWAKSMGGTNSEMAMSVDTDANGNVYTSGFFYDTVDFDPNSSIFNLTSLGNKDVFISKLDASGNFIFAKNIGGISIDQGVALELDVNKNIYLTGIFQETVDFDPSNTSYTLASSASGTYDTFIAKYDSIGNFIYAGNLSSNSNFGVFPFGLSVTPSNEVFVTGIFSGTCDLDPGVGTTTITAVAPSVNTYIIKLFNNPNNIFEIDSQFDSIAFYPNPSPDFIIVESEKTISFIHITDLFGNKIKTIDADKNRSVKIDIHEIPQGIYFLNLQSDKKTKVIKVIKT